MQIFQGFKAIFFLEKEMIRIESEMYSIKQFLHNQEKIALERVYLRMLDIFNTSHLMQST